MVLASLALAWFLLRWRWHARIVPTALACKDRANGAGMQGSCQRRWHARIVPTRTDFHPKSSRNDAKKAIFRRF
jgi:hypothetical protein